MTDDEIREEWSQWWRYAPSPIIGFARAIEAKARAEEREACAALCDQNAEFFGPTGEQATHPMHKREHEVSRTLAAAIRARKP